MLPKQHRINTQLFKEIFAEGKNFHSELLFLKIAPLENDEVRFAFVVSKKTAKLAVTRNKIKRRARAITSKKLSEFKKGIGVIVFLKKGVENLKSAELEKVMLESFAKAKIFA
jgi:ribonuclease P protein component